MDEKFEKWCQELNDPQFRVKLYHKLYQKWHCDYDDVELICDILTDNYKQDE
jgi:hypothetical protein